jgi:hypothetical protein
MNLCHERWLCLNIILLRPLWVLATGLGSPIMALLCMCTVTWCGGVTGRWIRVAGVNSRALCPDNLVLADGFCRMDCIIFSGCNLVTIPTYNISYSHVCGRMWGHSIGYPDTNFSYPLYVDSVSLTHGDPREHIWTFAAADKVMECPCGGGNPPFCDAADHRGTAGLQMCAVPSIPLHGPTSSCHIMLVIIVMSVLYS